MTRAPEDLCNRRRVCVESRLLAFVAVPVLLNGVGELPKGKKSADGKRFKRLPFSAVQRARF
jgi:hypothetical protein